MHGMTHPAARRDMAAFAAKRAAFGPCETRDAEPALADVLEAQERIGRAFEEFKGKNDARLDEIDRRGTEDAVAREQVDRINTDITKLNDQLDKLAKRMARPDPSGDGGEVMTPEQREHHDAFLSYLRNPKQERERAALQDIERRAIQTTVPSDGGSAVPHVISREVARNLSEAIPLRQIVSVVRASTPNYKELVDVRGMTYGWRGETDAVNATDTPKLAEVEPTFGMLHAYPKATEESLDDMFFDVRQWLVTSMVEGFAEGEENAIVNGDGTKKPTGFLSGTPTNEADGTRAFGTLQYIPGGHASELQSGDALIDLVQAPKVGYRRNATFVMNRATAGVVRKMKDGQGNYLWSMGNIQRGQPATLLGYPIVESEEMPDVAANAFPIAFGDFKAGYVLVDLVEMRLTEDNNITQPGYVKWYGRRRIGGKTRKSEAIKLLKIAAS